MTDEQRYYAKEEDYLEVFLERNKLLQLRPNILISTNYNNTNINTMDLNQKEIEILQKEIGFNPQDIKVLSFWS
jgi:cupin superfamily acireductone dioxygenase involved in methionine salvage